VCSGGCGRHGSCSVICHRRRSSRTRRIDALGLDVNPAVALAVSFMLRRIVAGLDIELDTSLLTCAQCIHASCDFAAQDSCYTLRYRVLDLVLADHAADAVAQTFNLETFWDATHELDGVDSGADFGEQAANEVRLVHGVFEQIGPEVCIILFFGEGDCETDVGEFSDDEIKRALGLASLGEDVSAMC
jgi:hypothetical protein